MLNRHLMVVVVGVCSSTVGLALPACNGPDRTAAAPTKVPTVPVTVATAAKAEVPLQIQSIATVEPFTTVAIRPQVTGELRDVHFTEGSYVKKDELLFNIDPRWFQTALLQAEGTLSRDHALSQDAARESARQAELFAQNVATVRERDQSQAAADSLAGTVRTDEAAVENARLQLAYCTIRSPIDGRTGDLLVHSGNIVKSSETTLVSLNQISPIYVACSVPERNLARIHKYMAAGNPVMEAEIPGDDGPPERGELAFVDSQVDTTTSTIRLKGTFPNESHRLWPGQFVRVIITLTTQPDAVVVPARAVQAGQSGQFVFVVNADLTVEMRNVVAGETIKDQTQIQQGVAAGEIVVTDGHLRLANGTKVTIKERSSASDVKRDAPNTAASSQSSGSNSPKVDAVEESNTPAGSNGVPPTGEPKINLERKG